MALYYALIMATLVKKFIYGVILLSFLPLFGESELKITADRLSHSTDQTTSHAAGKVVLQWEDIELKCDQAEFRHKSQEVLAQGNVVITQGERGRWSAQSLKVNLANKHISFGPFAMRSPVWYATGESGNTLPDGRRQITICRLTTCDCEKPHYSLGASSATINEEKRTFVAKHVTLRVGGVPIFYLPAVWGTLDNSTGLIFKPGYSGRRGAYLRLGQVVSLPNGGAAQFYVDAMSKRGFGIGQETEYSTEPREVRTHLYGIHDEDTAETSPGWDRRFKRTEDRYRLNLYWREDLDESWTLRLNADMLSDISMLEDWFRRDYRHWAQPKSFFSLGYENSWLNGELYFRPRINDFYTVVERLPELRLDVPTINIPGLPLEYSSENSAGYLSMKWRNYQRPRQWMIPPGIYDPTKHGDNSDYAAFRADTLHTIVMPLDMEYFTFAPRLSLRATSYSRSSRRKVSQKQLADNIAADNPDEPRNRYTVTNYDRDGGSRTRFAMETGVEMGTRFYSDWEDFQVPMLEARQLRHVIRPYLNYTFAPEPSEDRDHLYFFDEIDRLEKQHFLRIGLDQYWQVEDDTDGSMRNLLSLESFFDYHFDRGDESERYPGDLAARLAFMPTKKLSLHTAALYDSGVGNLLRGEAGIRYGQPAEGEYSLSMRYIYRNGHLSRSVWSMGSTLTDFFNESGYIKKHFEDADTLAMNFTMPLNSITSLEVTAEYDFENSRIAEHHYYLTRKLHCWTVMAGCGWDYNDFEVLLLLRLNAFPKVKLDLNI